MWIWGDSRLLKPDHQHTEQAPFRPFCRGWRGLFKFSDCPNNKQQISLKSSAFLTSLQQSQGTTHSAIAPAAVLGLYILH